MVDGKMAEKADKAKRSTRLGLHDKKRPPLPLSSGNFNVAGVWNDNGSPSIERRIRDGGSRCLFRGFDDSPTIVLDDVSQSLAQTKPCRAEGSPGISPAQSRLGADKSSSALLDEKVVVA
ncbi:hypothetical protein TcBrA4_0074360 [Trypanosoma cruzi]|nr:hypothetical protein TcBrA4_0074360 [Trypanosoma cruzi]